MSSLAIDASTASTTAAAPMRVSTSPIEHKTDSAPFRPRNRAEGGAAAKSSDTKNHYFWRNGHWHTASEYSPRPADIVLSVQNPKNKAVRGALEKLQKGAEANRDTTVYLMEGIRKWCYEQKRSVGADAEEEFVKYVWHHMRQKQRDNAATVEARRLQTNLAWVRGQLKDPYAEFPDERKTDDELVAMFRKLGHWTDVTTSEQRRIASKKRHEKEEKLIDEKFCGDRAAYNRWKALNEQVSYGRIRDVSPQLLVKFAKWFEENPDFLYPGSRCIAVETAAHKLITGFREPDYSQVMMTRADVSKERMLDAIRSVMAGLKEGTCTVTLKFERSPKQFTMTDKYPLLTMHGCQRLISGSEHHIVAVHSYKLVFKETTTMIKRLPAEFHKQLKGHCEREGLFKEVTCHKVYEYTPGMVTSVLFRGQSTDGDPFHIRLRMTERAGKTFDFATVREAKKAAFIDSIKKEASDKRLATRRNAETRQDVYNSPKERQTAKRMASIRGPMPPSPSCSPHKNMAQELIELGKMFRDGLLSDKEFVNAKKSLIN